MAYTKYSLTPANNTAAPPDGAPEGMLPSAVNDTMRDMMAQIRDVGDGVRDGTYTMTAPKITGGTITGVTLTGNTLTNPVITGATLTTSAFNGTVGATTASTGAFTTLSTSSTTTFSGLTASTALALDASKNVVSVTNTGTGNNVLSASPTLTGTIAGASLSLSSLTSGRVTYAGASGLLSDSAGLTYNGASLTISSGASASALIATSTSSGGTALNIQNNGTVNALIGGYLSCIGSGSATDVAIAAYQGALAFATNGANERMRITSTGLVGIGTSSPNAKLQVTSSAFPVLKVADAIGGGALALGDEGTNNNYVGVWRGTANSISGGGFLNVQGNGIAFMSSDNVFGSASERMRIDTSGNLLVNGTSTIGTGGKLMVTSTLDTLYAQSTSSTSYAALVLNVQNTACNLASLQYGNTTNVGTITTNGTGVTYGTASDYRLKENVVPMTGALAKVAQLNPVTYKWKSDGSDGQGFIAHELQAVVPDCVTGVKDGLKEDGNPNYQNVDTSFLVATLVSAIQELKAEFDEYKATHP